VKSCVIYLTKIISPGSPALATVQNLPGPATNNVLTAQSAFDPNWFTYGGDISERVKTVRARSKESNIRLKPSFEQNDYQQQFK